MVIVNVRSPPLANMGWNSKDAQASKQMMADRSYGLRIPTPNAVVLGGNRHLSGGVSLHEEIDLRGQCLSMAISEYS